MFKFGPYRKRGGGVLQSAMPKGMLRTESRKANGLNLRGVVIRLYTRDFPPPGTGEPAATYAWVMTYGERRGQLPRVQITQPVGSLHTGQVGGLRATTMPTDGRLDLDHSNPATMDGSHVVVSFLDDDLSQPYISAILEHPQADGGGPLLGPVEDRTRVRSDDGRPLLVRWNGCTWGVDGQGNFLLDLRNAHDGTLVDGGAEPPPAADGTRGNYQIRLPVGSTLSVQIGDQDALLLEHSAATGKLTIGDGAFSAAVAEHLQAHVEAIKQWVYTQVKVLTLFGPSSTPAAAGTPEPPAWDPKINSDKLQLPDTT